MRRIGTGPQHRRRHPARAGPVRRAGRRTACHPDRLITCSCPEMPRDRPPPATTPHERIHRRVLPPHHIHPRCGRRAGPGPRRVGAGRRAALAPGRPLARGRVRRPARHRPARAGAGRPVAAAVALVHPARAPGAGRARRGRPSRGGALPAPDPAPAPDVRRRPLPSGPPDPDRRRAGLPVVAGRGGGQARAQRGAGLRHRPPRAERDRPPGRRRGAGHRLPLPARRRPADPTGAAPPPQRRHRRTGDSRCPPTRCGCSGSAR